MKLIALFCSILLSVLLCACAPRQSDRIIFKHIGAEDFGYPLLCIAKEYLPAPVNHERFYKLAVVSPDAFELCLKILRDRAVSEHWPVRSSPDFPNVGAYNVVLLNRASKDGWFIPSGTETEETLAVLLTIREPKRGVALPEDAANGIEVIRDYLREIHAIGQRPEFAESWSKRAKLRIN
jgi:hypothetical protein